MPQAIYYSRGNNPVQLGVACGDPELFEMVVWMLRALQRPQHPHNHLEKDECGYAAMCTSVLPPQFSAI